MFEENLKYLPKKQSIKNYGLSIPSNRILLPLPFVFGLIYEAEEGQN